MSKVVFKLNMYWVVTLTTLLISSLIAFPDQLFAFIIFWFAYFVILLGLPFDWSAWYLIIERKRQ